MHEEAWKIIGELAENRRVENLICNIAHTSRLGADLQDLSQMVYETLLEYEPERIVGLHQRGDLDFFLVRIISTQLHSPRSDWHYKLLRFGHLSEDITDKDFADEQ